MGGETRSEEYLRVSISLPSFSMELTSTQPDRALREVRRIVESLDPPANQLAELQLTEEFEHNQELAARVRSALVLNEEVRVAKRILPVQVECGGETTTLALADVRHEVSQLFAGIDHVRECFVHLRGDLDRDQQLIVMDCVRHTLGVTVRSRFFSTRKNVEGRVLVEAVCFCAVG